MTLNFWPFNREQTRQAAERKATTEARVEEVRTNFFSPSSPPPVPPPFPCEDCGGLFVSDKLKPVTLITVRGNTAQPVTTSEKYFCPTCLPVSNLEIELIGRLADILDTVCFSTKEHWLQPFDSQGEEQTFLSSEDYAHLTCDDCGEIINTAKCRQCSTPKSRRK